MKFCSFSLLFLIILIHCTREVVYSYYTHIQHCTMHMLYLYHMLRRTFRVLAKTKYKNITLILRKKYNTNFQDLKLCYIRTLKNQLDDTRRCQRWPIKIWATLCAIFLTIDRRRRGQLCHLSTLSFIMHTVKKKGKPRRNGVLSRLHY